jgi:2'-hydroxyisoflavone reductase
VRILVLGGGSFVGRAIVTALLAGAHDLSLFSRGITGKDLFPGVPRLLGDRDTADYAALHGSRWDAVADVSGYVPRQVNQAMDALESERYLFISTAAVYQLDGVAPGSDESTPLRPAVRDADDPEQLTDATYGPAKVACEQDVQARYGDRATIVRPGKVAGPHDNQAGLVDWLGATAAGGPVELPGDPAAPVQLIDVRDLAALVLRLIEDGRGGAYNAVGPPVTITELIETCAAAARTTVQIVPVASRRAPLLQPDRPWSSRQRSAAKAQSAGMPSTPLLTTATDTLAALRSAGS